MKAPTPLGTQEALKELAALFVPSTAVPPVRRKINLAQRTIIKAFRRKLGRHPFVHAKGATKAEKKLVNATLPKMGAT